jgi:hypothetical protein
VHVQHSVWRSASRQQSTSCAQTRHRPAQQAVGDFYPVLIVCQQLICYKESLDRTQAANPAEELQCCFEARTHTLQLILL